MARDKYGRTIRNWDDEDDEDDVGVVNDLHPGDLVYFTVSGDIVPSTMYPDYFEVKLTGAGDNKIGGYKFGIYVGNIFVKTNKRKKVGRGWATHKIKVFDEPVDVVKIGHSRVVVDPSMLRPAID